MKLHRDFIFLSTIFLLLAACGGGGSDSPTDTIAPSVISQTPATSTMGENDAITLVFSESIDTASYTLGGDLATESDGGVWSQTNAITDTLTITPLTSWPVNTNHTLIINANDLAGNALATLTLTQTVYRGTVYYVDATMPNDSLSGLSPATARKFIHTAVADASVPATILVNAGDYLLSYETGTHVVLREGVLLYGGFNADFTVRDPSTYISRIEDRSTSGTGTAIKGDGAVRPISSATIVDGFTIQGSSQGATTTIAIDLSNNAAPLIQHNIINGGSGTTESIGIRLDTADATIGNNSINGGNGGTSTGIYNTASAAQIQNNNIHGGFGGAYSRGILNIQSAPSIHDNLIYGGDSGGSYGIDNNVSSPDIQRNTINGGNARLLSMGISSSSSSHANIINNLIYGGNAVNGSVGIHDQDSTATVRNNIIHGGNGQSNVIASFGSAPVVENNILLAKPGSNSTCFIEATGVDPLITGTPQTLRNNNFSGCDVIYLDRDIGCTGNADGDNNPLTCTLAEMNALLDIPEVGGNISADPQFVDIDGADNDMDTMEDNDWHFSPSSPASVTAGGLNGVDQGWSFIDDKDGVMRPAAGNTWSMGAYEPN